MAEGEIVDCGPLQAAGEARKRGFWHNGAMPCTWTPCSLQEIERTRRRRRVQRLEQRLACLRRGTRALFAADIHRLEAELCALTRQMDD